MITHLIYIDESNLDFINEDSADMSLVRDIITKYDKPFRLQIGDHFTDLIDILMYEYENERQESYINKFKNLLRNKYNKTYKGVYVSGFRFDDPSEDRLYTMVKLNFV